MTILQIILFIGAIFSVYIGYQHGHQDGLKEGIAIGYRRGTQVSRNANR
jgi:hypothetical protein